MFVLPHLLFTGTPVYPLILTYVFCPDPALLSTACLHLHQHTESKHQLDRPPFCSPCTSKLPSLLLTNPLNIFFIQLHSFICTFPSVSLIFLASCISFPAQFLCLTNCYRSFSLSLCPASHITHHNPLTTSLFTKPPSSPVYFLHLCLFHFLFASIFFEIILYFLIPPIPFQVSCPIFSVQKIL